jgi:hypothetical protein
MLADRVWRARTNTTQMLPRQCRSAATLRMATLDPPGQTNRKRLRFFGQVLAKTSWVRNGGGRGGFTDVYTNATLWYDQPGLITASLTTKPIASSVNLINGSYAGSTYTASATVIGFCDPARNASMPCCAVDGCSSCSRYVLCDACGEGWNLQKGLCVPVAANNSSTVTCEAPYV